MADRLATPEDLASLLERDDIDAYKAGVLVETATAIVQATVRQRIVQVVADPLTVMGTTQAWLQIPQIPVTAVTSVTLDGTTLTAGADYKVFGSRLWRRIGWQSNWGQYGVFNPYGGPVVSYSDGVAYEYNHGHTADYAWMSQAEPSGVVVVCTHGYPPGHQGLQLGRSAVLSMCAGAYGNPAGLKSESIDDYAVMYAALSGQLEASSFLLAALRRQYGRRANLVRIS